MGESSKISSDYVSDILEEIALEGLDGITAEALWFRLSVRPNFCFKIDEGSKNFIWKIVVRLTDVKFYEIPEPRATIKHYNPAAVEDNPDATLELDQIYPYCKLKNVTGVLGSCQYYSVRVDITDEVRKMNLKEIQEKWANKLVIVASQEIRTQTLLGKYCTPNIDFTKMTVHYDILERIGRSRFLGLATCGKGSIQSVVEDCKSIFHYMKFLFHHKLIKKQTLPGNAHVTPNASKVYLTRFFEECLNDNMAILHIAIDELKSRPNYCMPSDEFNALFVGKKKERLKKFRKSNIFKKFISISKSHPYRTFFPDASQSEWEKKSKGSERSVRCVKLVNPDIELTDLLEKDCDMDDEESSSSGFLSRGIFYENMPVLSQAYHHIKNSGSFGMSQGELVLKMGLNKRFVRGLIKRLTSEKHCQFYIENDGRRRFKRCIVGENIQTKAAASELVQILSESVTPIVSSDAKETKVKTQEESKPTGTIAERLNIPQIQEENMSYRTLRRIGMIIKTIKAHRFRLFSQITKYINEEEIKEGVTSRVDRVTVIRLLKKLENDGLIKVVHMSGPYKVYADPTFELDEKQMETLHHNQSLITDSDSAKSLSESQGNLENEFSPYLLENFSEMKKMMKGIDQKTDKNNQPPFKESELVYSPKFIRLSILHDLIFTLVYEYTGILGKSQEEMIEELSKTTAIDEDLRKEMPKLYCTQVSPYMFVPPLSHTGKLPGWFLISDILIRLPLSVAVKTVRVCDTSPELWKYLNHPIRKYFLVKDLPLTVRRLLFSRKNQMGYLYHEFKRLCFMGLTQYGQKLGREHYQTLVYLNKKASLLDTSTSPPAYYQVPTDVAFEVKQYNFETKNDVTKYWMDLFNICMETNLGVKANMIGKEILSERELSKESLKKYLEAKTVIKALEEDNGNTPGDHLGAGGLDSVMFSFLRSNWTGPINKIKDEIKSRIRPVKTPLQKVRREQVMKRLLLKRSFRRRGIIKMEKTDNFSVSEEKPKKSKFRKIKERECKFKRRRRTAYDEIDLEALKLMNTLRVTWSVAEDNLLLICRVAMMFLCPNVRTFVRIPWSEVRRILQEHLPESKNKTQRAIARRIINMLKNPTTVRSVQLCLEELKEMPEAVEKFDCSNLLSSIKPSAPNLSELQGHLYKKFQDLVSFLKDRFIDNTDFSVKTDKDLIPDTLAEFLAMYQFDDGEKCQVSIKTIRENVIRAIFMSSLSCRADKTSSAVQLFDIYRQYNEDELQSTIKKLHADKVITVSKKAGNSLFKSGKILPLSFTPYKLSFAFQNMLNMRYAHAIYQESYSQINKLQEQAAGEEFEVDLNECNMALFALASKGFVFFRTIIPDQIIILDSGNFSDAAYSKMLERYCEMLRYSGSNSKVVCTSGKIISSSEVDLKKRNDESVGENKGDAEEVEDEEKEEEEEEEVVKAKKAKLDIEVINKTETKNENKRDEDAKSDTGTNVNDKEQLTNKTTRSSRVILYMMREEAKKEANNDSGRKAQELYMVNASKIIGKVDKENLELYANERGPKAAAVIVKDILSRSLVPMNLIDEESFVEKVGGNEDMKGIKNILDFISSKKELGATIKELNLNCQGVNLCSIMKHLIDSKIVIKSGIYETRFISQKYCTPWLLSSFKMTRLEREKVKPTEVTGITLEKKTEIDQITGDELPKKKPKGVISLEEIKSDDYVSPQCSTYTNNKMKLIIRPWIRIDGSLNRKVLDRFLGTILTFVMTNPGISVKNIMDKFSPHITPIWTKDLIEILFDVGCVTLTSLVVVQKPNLFSKSVVRISDCYTGLEEDNFVAVEAKVDAVTTLGLFIGKKTYSKDFLVD